MPNICHELIIGATAEKVFNAVTSQQGLSAWWTPETKADTQPGSFLRFCFGSDYYKEMKIVEIDPFVSVKWSCTQGANEWVGTHISFRLYEGNMPSLLHSHPEAEGQIQQQNDVDLATLLVFEHANWREYTPMFAECNYTWGQFLRSLKLLCETGQGLPWPNQHRTA